jgi:signal transduction histidine kinase
MTHSLTSQPARKDRILVVDDSPENLSLVETILETEGYETIALKDGKSAIDSVKQSPPQLILLDVMMPGLDGFEVTRQIRALSDLPYIPILLITAYDRPSAAKGLDLGADEFIRKPVDVDELLARVRSLLRLKHSLDDREQMVRMREDFVSRLTHDLRTPLIAANSVLDLLAQGALGEISEEILEALSTLARSNRNLLQMVNILLEVYRYESERKVLNFTTVDVKAPIEEVLQELTPLAERKKLSLNLKVLNAERDRFLVNGDRLELHRLFMNLIGNAIKFTDRGWIKINLRQALVAEDDKSSEFKAWLIISIEDSGAGIAPQELPFLFNRFQVGNHRRAGSGLGLHLSRQIVETHQGTIALKSELGRGSTFVVRLPALIEEKE